MKVRTRKSHHRLTFQSLEKRQLLAGDIAGAGDAEDSGLFSGALVGAFEIEPNNTIDQANNFGLVKVDRVVSGDHVQPTSPRYVGLPRSIGDDIFRFETDANQSMGWQLDVMPGFDLRYTLRNRAGQVFGTGTIDADVVTEGYVESLPAGEYFFIVHGGAPRVTQQVQITEYSLTLRPGQSQPPALEESESNDTFETADVVGEVGIKSVRGAASYERNSTGGVTTIFNNDYYRFTVPRDGDLSITLAGVPTRDFFLVGELLDQDRNLVRSLRVNAGETEDSIELQGVGRGDYFLLVRASRAGSGGANGSIDYSVSIRGPEPETPVAGREQESNDSLETANYLGTLTQPLHARGQLDFQADPLSVERRIPEVDYFRFEVVEKARARFQGGIDFNVHGIEVVLRDEAGDELEVFEFNSSRTFNRLFIENELSEGTYYLEVRGRENDSGSNLRPNYALTIEPISSPGPTKVSGQEVEPNDTLSSANYLGSLESSLTVEGVISFQDFQGRRKVGEDARFGNPDIFSFDLDTLGSSNVTFGVTLENYSFPLTVELLDEDGNSVTSFPMIDLLSNRQIAELTSGVYFIGISTPPLGESPAREPRYTLTVRREDIEPIEADQFEPNNATTSATAISSGDYGDLSIHTADDKDFFVFELLQEGTSADNVTISFDGTSNDFDLRVLNGGGRTLLQSDSTSDRESIPLAGLSSGSYFIEVYAADRSTGMYSLSLDVNSSGTDGGALREDAYEENDTFATAYDLLGVEGRFQVNDLTLDVIDGQDRDYFRFEMLGTGRESHQIETTAVPAGANRTLRLYNSSQQLLDSGDRRVSLSGLAAGTYYLSIESTEAAGIEYALSFFAPVRQNDFTIDLDVQTPGISAELQAAIDDAVQRWETIIVGDLPDFRMPEISPALRQSIIRDLGAEFFFPSGERVDDVFIAFQVSEIDGPGNTLARAGAIGYRNSGTPAFGLIQFDLDDLQAAITQGTASDIIFHEVSHVLHATALWDERGLRTTTTETTGIGFIGPKAVAAFNALEPTSHQFTAVPLENIGRPGTICSHIAESIFDREILTGYIEPPGVPMHLSTVSIAMMDDIGYEVDYSQANDMPIGNVSRASASPFDCSGRDGDSEHEALHDLASLAAPVQTLAPPLAQLFLTSDRLNLDLQKSQQNPEERAIRGGETQVYTLTLEGRGTAENHFKVESVIDRPLQVVLKDSSGNVLSRGLAENRQYVSLAGYPAGNYSIEVSSVENNRFLPPVALDVDGIEPEFAALDLDGNGRTSAFSDGLILFAALDGANATTIDGLRGPRSTRSGAEILKYIEQLAEALDVDANGRISAFSDGLIAFAAMDGALSSTISNLRGPQSIRDGQSVIQRVNDLSVSANTQFESSVGKFAFGGEPAALFLSGGRAEGEPNESGAACRAATSPCLQIVTPSVAEATLGGDADLILNYRTETFDGVENAATAAALAVTISFNPQDINIDAFAATFTTDPFQRRSEDVSETERRITITWTDTNVEFPGSTGGNPLARLKVNFLDGKSVAFVRVSARGDDFFDQVVDGETVTIQKPGQESATLTIESANSTQDEGDDGVTRFTFTVKRLGNTSGTTTVNYTVAGTGTSPASADDFQTGTFLGGAITFNPGETEKEISINVVGDTVVEMDETFVVSLVPAAGIEIDNANATAIGTILNDDVSLSIAPSDANKPEGNSGPTPFTFIVTRGGDLRQETTVNFAVTGSGSNPADAADFIGGSFPSGQIQFAPGETEAKLITIQVAGDTTVEPDNGFTVTITSPGATIPTPSAVGLIRNDDSEQAENRPPVITSAPNALARENQTLAIDVNATDADGDTLTYSIIGGADQEALNIVSNTGVITFKIAPDFENPGSADGDNIYNVRVQVSDGKQGDVTQDIAITVTDDPSDNPPANRAPQITSANVASVPENQTFAIDVNATDADGDTLTYSIVGGADRNAFSIVASTGAITFSTAPDFENPSDENGDNIYHVRVQVSDGKEGIATQDIAITVTDVDDTDVEEKPVVSFTSSARSVSENVGAVNITVSLSKSADSTITVPFSVAGLNGATLGSDFTVSPSPLIFAPGQTTATITVNVIDDAISESNESIRISLGASEDATIAAPSDFILTIIDDDRPQIQTRILTPSRVASLHVIPGDSIPTAIVFQVNATTTVSISSIGTASMTETIRVLDGDLQQISEFVDGITRANLTGGTLSAIIFEPQTTDRYYWVRSSEGPDALGRNGDTNIFQPTDTNGDALTSPLDALMVLNGLRQSAMAEGESAMATRMLDVNADGEITPLDALLVLNHLARRTSRSLGEGERVVPTLAETDDRDISVEGLLANDVATQWSDKELASNDVWDWSPENAARVNKRLLDETPVFGEDDDWLGANDEIGFLVSSDVLSK